MKKVLVLFGTRPEVIKLAPVVDELRRAGMHPVVVSSSQHTDLLRPFVKLLGVSVDHDLRVMKRDQSPTEVCSKTLAKLDGILRLESPAAILVQGDTTTTLAGAIAGFYHRIPVGHVEAGLRSGDRDSPFPEEMNRRLVTQLASFHYAATKENRDTLIAEGVPERSVVLTGNPVVDSLRTIGNDRRPSPGIERLLEMTNGQRRVLLTTHRRESFGETMAANLAVLSDFVRRNQDVCLIFPVHPNPNVRSATEKALNGLDRVHLLDPLDYVDFVKLMQQAWIIVSDSGGVQEEAPSLGKPLLVLRENTERPEAVAAGVAKLVGGSPAKLRKMLDANYRDAGWIESVKKVPNPFGDGRAAERIVKHLKKVL